MKSRYYVNEAKRTVVYVIDDCEYDVRRKVRKLFRSHGGLGETFNFIGERSYLNGPFKGKAKCAPDDVWDEATGIQIARERAYAKYNAAFNKEIDYLFEVTDLFTDALEDMYLDSDF